MANEDVLIKVAADINQAVQSLNQIVGQMGEVVKAVTDTNRVAADGEKTAKSFWETWLTGANQTGASAEFWGKQMSDAFDILKGGVADAITSLPRMVTEAAQVGDEMKAMAARLNTSVEAIAELKFVAGQSNVSLEALALGMQEVSKSLADGSSASAKAIEGLGLSLNNLKELDPQEAFFTILETIKQTVPVSEQGAKAMEIFGTRFKTSTMILKEDISALRKDFKDLGGGMTTDLADAGDAYGDALNRIQLVQDNFRNQIAMAVLPALNSLLETMPMLGGAALTVGEGLLSLGGSMLPLLGNIAMLKSSGMIAWFTEAAASGGVLTSVLGGLKAALALLGPAAAVVGTAFAAWKVGEWIGNLKLFNGELQTLTEYSEYAGVKVLQFLGITDKTSDADIRAAIASRRRAEELKNTTEATQQATVATTQQNAGLAQFTQRAAEVNAAYAKLTAAQKAQIKAAIETGASTKEIADLLAKEMNVSATVAAGAIEKFKKQLVETKKEAEKSPFQKLMEDAKGLAASINTAVQAGAPMQAQLDSFGRKAADAAKQAELLPGALAKLPPEVVRMANAFNAAQLAEKMKTLVQAALDLAKAFTDKVVAGATAANAAIKKMTQEMELNMLSASERRLRQIDFEEEAAIESISRQNAELDRALREQVTKIRANFAERRKAEEELAAVGEGISRERLEQLEAEERAAIEAAESQVNATRQQFSEQERVTRQYYDQKRAIEEKDTGNFQRDAELRGLKTKEVYERELRTQRETLAFMQANREQFTAADIRKQEEIVEAAEVAAGKVKSDWSGAIEALTQAFEQLANISGDAFGGIVKGVGEVIGSINVMTKGLQTAFGEKGIGGIGAAFSQAKGSAGGFMGIFKGIAGSIPMIGTAISGIVSAASAAVKVGKKVWDAFTKSGGEKAAKEVGRDFGVKISEEMGDAFNKTAKELFKGDRFAANIYHMADIVKEAGGISEKNFSQMLGRLRDVFVMVETGKFSVEQATKVLDENFGAFAQHVLQSGKVASKEFTELIQLNARFGTQSKQIMDFVAGQTSRLGGALAKLAGGQEQTNESMGRFERLAVDGFNAAIAAGVPFLDAIEQMGPALDKIVEGNKKLGREGGAAIQELLKFREVANANRDLVDSAGALNEVMLALSNTGALNAETMADLQAQGTDTFNALVAAGFTEQQSLQQMKGFLEQVRTAHTELGLPIDANTQKLIDQATAQGVLKAEQMSTNDIMLQGLGAIIEALGGKLPAAFEQAKNAGVAAGQTIRGATDEATAAMDAQAQTLAGVPWAQYAGRGVAAGQMAGGAMGGVGGAVAGVDQQLSSTDWSGWSAEAVAAAEQAQSAIDSVSFGSSPGGIKEIPLKLREAMKAVRDWKAVTIDSAVAAKDAINGIGMQPDLGKIGEAATDAAVTSEPAMAAGSNVSVQIQTIDTANMEAAVQSKILPALVKTIRTGGRAVSDMQGVLR